MIKIQVKIDQASLDQAKDKALDIAAQRVAKGFDTVVGPHLLAVAKKISPVSDQAPTRNPRRSSFQPLRPATREEGRFTTEELDTLRDIQGLSALERAKAFRKAFGSGTNREFAKFFRGADDTPNAGRTPDVLRVGRGGVRGAFIHKPGTLRDSHIYVPARRVRPDKVIAEVRATAEYAAAQHEGFTHNKSGKWVAPKRKWLNDALRNATSDLKSPGSYKG